MTQISPTTAGIARAITHLDRYAATTDEKSEAVVTVARHLARQFARHNGWGGRKKVTTRDVRAALIAHDVNTLTVQQFAGRIAHRIRNDFTDGSEL